MGNSSRLESEGRSVDGGHAMNGAHATYLYCGMLEFSLSSAARETISLQGVLPAAVASLDAPDRLTSTA